MGIEVYLIRIVPKDLSISDVDKVLKSLNFRKVSTDSYELVTDEGINEAKILAKGLVDTIFLRFSLANPDDVIEQTIELLEGIKKQIECSIFIERSSKPIDINNPDLIRGMEDKKEMFREHYLGSAGLKPIRGGKETFDHIEKSER